MFWIGETNGLVYVFSLWIMKGIWENESDSRKMLREHGDIPQNET
jgi:hypothetical protein